MLVHRNYSLTESQDWQMNVQSRLGKYLCSTPMYHEGVIVAWQIKPMYE